MSFRVANWNPSGELSTISGMEGEAFPFDASDNQFSNSMSDPKAEADVD